MKKIIYITYVAVLIVMGAATFIEAAEGTPYVHREIYGTWWFTALWVALAFLGTIKVFKGIKGAKDFKGVRGFKVILLHLSFLIILLGALLTHLTGRSGTIHLRMNEPQDIAEIEHNGEKYLHRLNFSAELTDFQIIEDEAGNVKDYRSTFRILSKSERPVLGDSFAEPLSVSMNNIATHGNIRFYQQSYDNDLRGATLMINRDPYGIPVTYCGYALLFISFIWVVSWGNRHYRENRDSRGYRDCRNNRNPRHYRVLTATLLLTTAWCIYYFLLDGSWAQIPVLCHPLLIFHVVIIILAYALLLIQTAVSAWWLIKNCKNHQQGISEISPRSGGLRGALCFLSIGIFLGAIWANISWGNYWTWDSKETWALITLMIYAIPLHKRSLPIFSRPRVYHIYMVLAFLTVLMTYFGVNYFLTGMHSYA